MKSEGDGQEENVKIDKKTEEKLRRKKDRIKKTHLTEFDTKSSTNNRIKRIEHK